MGCQRFIKPFTKKLPGGTGEPFNQKNNISILIPSKTTSAAA